MVKEEISNRKYPCPKCGSKIYNRFSPPYAREQNFECRKCGKNYTYVYGVVKK